MKRILLLHILTVFLTSISIGQINGIKSIGTTNKITLEEFDLDEIGRNLETSQELKLLEEKYALGPFQTYKLNRYVVNDLDGRLNSLQNDYIKSNDLIRNLLESSKITMEEFKLKKDSIKTQFDKELAYYYQLVQNRHEDVYNYRLNKNLLNNHCLTRSIRFFPALNSTSGSLFYDGVTKNNKPTFFGNSGLIVSSRDIVSTTIYTEITKDYFGPIRVSLLTQVTATENERDTTFALADSVLRKNEAFQNLLAGGGNISMNINYPLLYIKPRGYGELYVTSSIIASTALPKVGTSLEKPLFNLDMGFDYSIILNGKHNNISFFLLGRSSALWASQGIFYEQLERTGDKDIFIFHRLTAGIQLSSSIRISINRYVSNGFVNDNFPTTFSVSLVPGK
jgi:hypothetical protein